MRNLSDITANMNVHAVLLWEASFHHFSLKKFAIVLITLLLNATVPYVSFSEKIFRNFFSHYYFSTILYVKLEL